MESVEVVTFNVNGLGDATKRKEVFHYLNIKNYNIIMLQETHSDKCSERWWSNQWGTKIWFSHGDTNARGVSILFSKKTQIEVHNVISSETGHFLILYCTLKSKKFLLVNVYAHNTDRPKFFQQLFHEIDRFAPDYTIIGGGPKFGNGSKNR